MQTLAEDCFARKDNVVDLNKEITELPATEEKSRKITKKHETDIKLVLPRSESKRFTLRSSYLLLVPSFVYNIFPLKRK